MTNKDRDQRRGYVAVVDDEPFIGDIIRRALIRHHEVDVFEDPEPLLQRLGEGRRYDLIFCDLMMPDTTGREIFDSVAKEWPEQAAKIVFISGVSASEAQRGILKGLNNLMLEKPFQLHDLREMVRDAID